MNTNGCLFGAGFDYDGLDDDEPYDPPKPHIFKGEIRNKKTNRVYSFHLTFESPLVREVIKGWALLELASVYAKGDKDALARDFYITWE